MSRHKLPGRKPGTHIFVGWDHPLLTYFVHVYDDAPVNASEDEVDEGPRLWIGGSPRELYDLDDLKRALRPYADLPHELAVTLYGDRDEGR